MTDSENVPVANKPETVYGSCITIQALALIAVTLRLFARSRLANGLGLDDLFVVLAVLSTGVGVIFVCLEPSAGLGKHQATLDLATFERYLRYTLGSIVSYTFSAAVIKISILFQYVRIARAESIIFRRVCFLCIAAVSIWGLFFFFGSLFSCRPVSGFWELTKPSKCILFGSDDRKMKLQAYVSHAATNMVLDAIIFAMPLYLLRNSSVANLSHKSKIGLLGVFALGGLVVLVSVLRLASIVSHELGLTADVMDVTWYTPITVIWSCVEVNIAVLCASIPIFWPVLTEIAFGKIMVTNEVEIRSDMPGSRLSSRAGERYDDEQELTTSMAWGGAYSKINIRRDS